MYIYTHLFIGCTCTVILSAHTAMMIVPSRRTSCPANRRALHEWGSNQSQKTVTQGPINRQSIKLLLIIQIGHRIQYHIHLMSFLYVLVVAPPSYACGVSGLPQALLFVFTNVFFFRKRPFWSGTDNTCQDFDYVWYIC